MKKEQKIPETFKEHIKSYLADLKMYKEYSKILRKNRSVYVCNNCNIIYPSSHDFKCDKCNLYMHLFLSSEVNIGIPSRKEKYAHIKEENEKIRRENEALKLQKEAIENKSIIDGFEDLKKIINQNNTDEILEYLIKLEKIDNYYKNVPENKKYLLKDITTLKRQKIEYILNAKFNKIWADSSRCSLFKSFIEELEYCKKRYPEYQNTLNKEIIKIQNCIEDLEIEVN